MDRRQLLRGMTALALGGSHLSSFVSLLNAQSAAWPSDTRGDHLSDREKNGLRGPVRICVVDGETWEYDLGGNILRRQAANWAERREYDGSGHLLKQIQTGSDNSTKETVYSYDAKGRLSSIRDGDGNRTHFQYDQQGRKISVRTFAQKDSDQQSWGVGSSDSVFEDAIRQGDLGVGLPQGGSFTTLYDEQERPSEVQIRDAKGTIVYRAVRSYGDNGQPNEEKMILENPALTFVEKSPAEERSQLDAARLKALNKAIATLMGGSDGVQTLYTYDEQRRMTGRHTRKMGFDVVTSIEYNDHGDIADERSTSKYISSVPVGVVFSVDEDGNLVPKEPEPGASRPPQAPEVEPSQVRYEYQYDSYGNWTERKYYSRSSESAPYQLVSTSHRQLSYY
jgi:YD repeat-containing protein